MLNSGTETPLAHGSGVGLWVMNWYVKKSGGELEITGNDSGTTVTMQLKRARSV
jgi:C4-dicarboxylate-specific signal transduction histidine kinase